MIAYTLYVQDGKSYLTVYQDGEVYQANSDHPRWADIVQQIVVEQSTAALYLFDVAATVAERFSLSERVAVENGTVFFDGDPVHTTLTEQILRFLRDDLPVEPLVRFWENLAANPSEHSREQLYTWLHDRDFTITEDGCFIAYKGLRDDMTSIASGPAYVDDNPVQGHVPNNVGSVVTIQRSYVDPDSFVGCSTGLHAGTWEYASDFAQGKVVTVKINPRDVVSVPTDCEAQKLRVCRYEVLEVIDAPTYEPLVTDRGTAYDVLGRPLPKRDAAGRFVKTTV
jgi:hypothetical protein